MGENKGLKTRKLTEKKNVARRTDKTQKRQKAMGGSDNNSPGPRRGLMCEGSVQSSIINLIG